MNANQIDSILHAVIAAGIVAASIFVKNPNSQQHAATVIGAVNTLLPMVDASLGVQPPAQQ
jgi:hypothetical protein